MKVKSRYGDFQADEENPYWISFSDIMAALLVIFILAAVVLILELTEKSAKWDKTIQEIAKAEQVRKSMLQEIEEELKKRNISITISDNDTVLRIPEDVLTFRQGKFDLPQDKEDQKIALEIGKVIFDSITKEDRWKYLDTIFIEGHTDKVPYPNEKIKGNWGLSTFRAISIWNFWNKNLPEGKRLKDLYNHNAKKLFSVSGYAETRPTSESLNMADSEDSLRKNRRIDIRVTVKRPKLEDYEAIKERLN